jgi:hypothetical protein
MCVTSNFFVSATVFWGKSRAYKSLVLFTQIGICPQPLTVHFNLAAHGFGNPKLAMLDYGCTCNWKIDVTCLVSRIWILFLGSQCLAGLHDISTN